MTSAYSKSSNSSGFNPNLQNFYEMICETVVSKTVYRISWFVFFLSVEFYYKIYCEEQFFGTLKLPKLKYPKTHLLFFKKNPHTVLKIMSPQISWKEFFSKKSFSRTWSFFRDCKITKLGLIFLPQKINYLIVFLNCDYFISI